MLYHCPSFRMAFVVVFFLEAILCFVSFCLAGGMTIALDGLSPLQGIQGQPRWQPALGLQVTLFMDVTVMPSSFLVACFVWWSPGR